MQQVVHQRGDKITGLNGDEHRGGHEELVRLSRPELAVEVQVPWCVIQPEKGGGQQQLVRHLRAAGGGHVIDAPLPVHRFQYEVLAGRPAAGRVLPAGVQSGEFLPAHHDGGPVPLAGKPSGRWNTLGVLARIVTCAPGRHNLLAPGVRYSRAVPW